MSIVSGIARASYLPNTHTTPYHDGQADMLGLFRTFPSMYLVEEADDLASHVLSSRLLMIHDTGRSCEDNVAELT